MSNDTTRRTMHGLLDLVAGYDPHTSPGATLPPASSVDFRGFADAVTVAVDEDDQVRLDATPLVAAATTTLLRMARALAAERGVEVRDVLETLRAEMDEQLSG